MLVHSWRILRKLGEGGYGYVYLVELPGLEGEHFTLKLSKFRQGEGGARADKERVLLSRVEHPNVVRVWGHGHWPHPSRGWPYLLLEYVEGLGLWRWLEANNPTPREVAQRIDAMAQALAAVHEKGGLHRDVKGDNVIVRASDGQPVLLDFGVGDYDDSKTVTRGVLPPGTAHYRSPEALRFLREHRDTQARYEFRPSDDLYSLGVLFYRLLTDEYPFSPSLPPDILYADIEQREPRVPSTLNPRVPAALSALVLRLLAKHPEARPASARALHEELATALHEADTPWDAPLFEWVEALTPHSRPTEEVSPWSALAPRQRLEAASSDVHPAPRRRHRSPEPGVPTAPVTREVPPPRAPTAAAPSTSAGLALAGVPSAMAAEFRIQRRMLFAAGLLGLATLLLVAAHPNVGPSTGGPPPGATIMSAASPPASPSPVPAIPDGGSAATPSPSEGEPPSSRLPAPAAVTAVTPSPEENAPAMSPRTPHASEASAPEKSLSRYVRRCFALAAGASLATACSGAPPRPTPDEPCPRETLAAMRANGIRLNTGFKAYWDASNADAINASKKERGRTWLKQPWLKIYENGPVVGRVEEPYYSGVPEGTLLYGYLWVDADSYYAIVHFTEIQLPSNGKRIPVCLMASDSTGNDYIERGVKKEPGSKEKVAILYPLSGAIFVDRYQ